MQLPQWRTIALHGVSVLAGAWGGISFAASHGVDLYAIYAQLNVVFADLTKLMALVAPFVAGAYAAYKASTANKLKDIATDPAAPAIAAQMPVTPATIAIGDAMQKQP